MNFLLSFLQSKDSVYKGIRIIKSSRTLVFCQFVIFLYFLYLSYVSIVFIKSCYIISI